ncbi:MAG TPA: FxLD family lanthipeptide [Pseudonocardiaceae bacterium]|nr:FxLD family lanthipeptide [Pseudonocardiaceae bacterium]
MNESSVMELEEEADPFALDVQVVTDVADTGPTACTTNDGCAGTCASSCASRG